MKAFPASPIVIRRSKRLGIVLVLFTGLPLGLALYQRLLAPAWLPAPAAPSFSGPLEFGGILLLGVLFLLRPARLILTPTELRYERLLRLWGRSWRWPEIAGFAWMQVGSGKSKRYAIVFSSGLSQVEVPAYWELPAAEVLDLLNQARSHWGGAPLATSSLLAQPRHPLLPARKTAPPPGPWAWLVGLLLIGAGSLFTYLFYYKDNFWLQGGCILLVVFGWLWLLFLALAALAGTPKRAQYDLRPATGPARLARRARQLGYLVAGVSWLGLLIGSLVVAAWQGEQRVARILATEPTATTVATVTELRELRGRGGSTVRTTQLTYQAGAEQVQQALPGIRQYVVGQRLRVRYAVGHPDMFRVVEEAF